MASETAETIGMLPVEVLQAAFWQLDPARTVAKFVDFGSRPRDDAAAAIFVALEDWANDGAPLTLAAGRDLATTFFGEDRPGEGQWSVAGRAIHPDALACPVFDIASTTDRIVPLASAVGIGRRLTLAQGHVGMMVGSRSRESLWQPLAQWLRDPTGG